MHILLVLENGKKVITSIDNSCCFDVYIQVVRDAVQELYGMQVVSHDVIDIRGK